MSAAQCRAARRRNQQRYGDGKRKARSIAEAISAERSKKHVVFKRKGKGR